MNIPTFIAGSFPKIVTSGKIRRKNEEGINDIFLRDYIKLIGDLLLVKKDLRDIKFTYIGGYEGIENINTAKLYFCALNYFFKELGYGELSKTNFVIVDEEQYTNNKAQVLNTLENTDFYLLGLGDDSLFGRLLDKFFKDGINLKEMMIRNNSLVASVCAGTVVSATNIYGGKYDTYYHDRPAFDYPKNYPTFNFNLVTMETNLYPESQTDEKNIKFKEECLLPDSYKKAFFGCRPNSYIVMNNNKITAVGEIYLFIDGEIITIGIENEKKDITKLNDLVNKYNENRNIDLKNGIKKGINELNNDSVDSYVEYYKMCEELVINNKCARKELLDKYIKGEINNILNYSNKELIDNDKLNNEFLEALNLDTNNKEELITKYNLIAIVKKYSKLYGNNYNEYFKDLYNIFDSLIEINPYIVLYFIECFSSLYENKPMKTLLSKTQIEVSKRVNGMSKTNCYFKRFWRL